MKISPESSVDTERSGGGGGEGGAGGESGESGEGGESGRGAAGDLKTSRITFAVHQYPP